MKLIHQLSKKYKKYQWMPASHPQISEKEDASIYAIIIQRTMILALSPWMLKKYWYWHHTQDMPIEEMPLLIKNYLLTQASHPQFQQKKMPASVLIIFKKKLSFSIVFLYVPKYWYWHHTQDMPIEEMPLLWKNHLILIIQGQTQKFVHLYINELGKFLLETLRP